MSRPHDDLVERIAARLAETPGRRLVVEVYERDGRPTSSAARHIASSPRADCAALFSAR